MHLDGSSDNINYTLIKGCIHILVCAEKSGWPLRSITSLRQLSGHTKNHLDQAFAELCMGLYGTGNRGDAKQDMLDWVQFHELAKKVPPY